MVPANVVHQDWQPLPADVIFYDLGPGGEQYNPGWRTCDPFRGWMTPGHIDAATFNRRISPEHASGIDPDTINHTWVVMSYHDESCTPDDLDNPDDPDDDYCSMVWTGWEDEDGRPIYDSEATADTPGAIAVTWGCPLPPVMA